MHPQVSFVVPLYNEAEGFAALVERLNKLLNSLSVLVEVVLVDDGSSDRTAELMQVTALSDERYSCVFLSRNFGHQFALSAGLSVARGSEAIMCIDGDLQDPPELFTEFYKLYQQGYDVVYGVRRNRKEGWLLRQTFHYYYRIQKKVSNIDMALDSGDFALLSRRVVDIMNKLPEESRYLRGLRSWIGFNQIGYEYDRPERAAGETKYPIGKRIKIALNGIFNFSELPIKFITNLGITAILIALVYFIYTLAKKIIFGIPIAEGFLGLLFTIILFSGVQLVSLGIIGEYIVRILFQVKERPLFIIKSRIVNKEFVKE